MGVIYNAVVKIRKKCSSKRVWHKFTPSPSAPEVTPTITISNSPTKPNMTPSQSQVICNSPSVSPSPSNWVCIPHPSVSSVACCTPAVSQSSVVSSSPSVTPTPTPTNLDINPVIIPTELPTPTPTLSPITGMGTPTIQFEKKLGFWAKLFKAIKRWFK